MQQKILGFTPGYTEIDRYFEENHIHSFLLVCDSSFSYLPISSYFESLSLRAGIKMVKFDDFQPNPLYESVVSGVRVFRRNQCECVVAVGGGSTMDMAKCIKLYNNMNGDGLDGDFLRQKVIANDIKLLVVPTTAGTGSEATRYAVIYYKGEKQSISDESCLPDTVLMDSRMLRTLPSYQRKAAMLDALCHCVESFWSVNSTEESKYYSREAMQMIMKSMEGYLINKDEANADMLAASHLAGKAINITQTTAGHAMCYKLTGLYGIAHGHAAALCVKELWPWMIHNTDKCIDPRGKQYMEDVFYDMAVIMGCKSAEGAANKFGDIFKGLGMSIPSASRKEYEILCKSVHHERLKNHPIALGEKDMDELYHRILKR